MLQGDSLGIRNFDNYFNYEPQVDWPVIPVINEASKGGVDRIGAQGSLVMVTDSEIYYVLLSDEF